MLELAFAFVGELLLGFVFEVVASTFIGSTLDFGFQSLRSPFLPIRHARKWLAIPGLLTIGLISGAISVIVLGNRVAPTIGFPGLSLVVAPLVAGAFLELVGRQMLNNGLEHTSFTSWWGGGSLAFGFAAARFLFLEA